MLIPLCFWLLPSIKCQNTTKGWVTSGQRPSYDNTEPCLTLPSSWEEAPRECVRSPIPSPQVGKQRKGRGGDRAGWGGGRLFPPV